MIDARGLRCPWPVARLARALREEAGGATIVADDPAAAGEIAAFAAERGYFVKAVDTELGAGWRLDR